jgi:hypothetical protein
MRADLERRKLLLKNKNTNKQPALKQHQQDLGLNT